MNSTGKLLTTQEAAALLTERGWRGYKNGPLKADTIKHWCAAGQLPGAYIEHRGPGRGFWLIPLEALDALDLPRRTESRSPS